MLAKAASAEPMAKVRVMVRHYHDQRRHQQGQDGDAVHRDPSDSEAGELDEAGVGLLLGAEDYQGEVLQQVADADGGDEHAQRRRLTQRLIGQKFDQHTKPRADHDADDDRDYRRQAKLIDSNYARVRADHDDVAVREVKHFGDAVHHCIAQSDERVYAAQAQAAYQSLNKMSHIGLPLQRPSSGRIPGGHRGLFSGLAGVGEYIIWRMRCSGFYQSPKTLPTPSK